MTSEVKEKGFSKLPNLVEVRKKVAKAQPERTKWAFGKVIKKGPKPAGLRFHVKVAKKLRDRLIAVFPPGEQQ